MGAVCLRALASFAVALTLVANQTVHISAQGRLLPGSGLVVVPEVQTNIESALASANALLVTDYHRVDLRFGPNVRIDAVIVTIGGAGTRVRGLRVQVPDESRTGRPESTSYVDIDEIAGLMDALDSMTDLVRHWTGSEDRRATVLSITSVGGLRIEIRETGRIQKAFLSTGLVEPAVMGFEIGDLPTLKQALEQGLALLNNK
jgi:hypothetical protein